MITTLNYFQARKMPSMNLFVKTFLCYQLEIKILEQIQKIREGFQK